jgi:hypothetical protein
LTAQRQTRREHGRRKRRRAGGTLLSIVPRTVCQQDPFVASEWQRRNRQPSHGQEGSWTGSIGRGIGGRRATAGDAEWGPAWRGRDAEDGLGVGPRRRDRNCFGRPSHTLRLSRQPKTSRISRWANCDEMGGEGGEFEGRGWRPLTAVPEPPALVRRGRTARAALLIRWRAQERPSRGGIDRDSHGWILLRRRKQTLFSEVVGRGSATRDGRRRKEWRPDCSLPISLAKQPNNRHKIRDQRLQIKVQTPPAVHEMTCAVLLRLPSPLVATSSQVVQNSDTPHEHHLLQPPK